MVGVAWSVSWEELSPRLPESRHLGFYHELRDHPRLRLCSDQRPFRYDPRQRSHDMNEGDITGENFDIGKDIGQSGAKRAAEMRHLNLQWRQAGGRNAPFEFAGTSQPVFEDVEGSQAQDRHQRQSARVLLQEKR